MSGEKILSNIGINKPNFNISVNEQKIKVEGLKELKEGVSLKDAEQRLKYSGDGFDTIGLEIDGKDFLAYGKGLSAKPGDQVKVNGQVGQVKFFEDDDNSFSEGIKSLSPGGVARAVLVSGSLIGFSAGAHAGGGAAIAAGYGKEVLKITAKNALVGSALIATTILVGSGLAAKYTQTNDYQLRDLTK